MLEQLFEEILNIFITFFWEENKHLQCHLHLANQQTCKELVIHNY